MSASSLSGLCVLLLIASASRVPAHAQTTWYVDDVSDPAEDGTAAHPFDAIQEGIDTSTSGDTVLVLDGTYTGVGNRNIDFGGRAIELRSANGPEHSTIDCEGRTRAFHFHSAETPASVLTGFKVRNGLMTGNGGGIFIEESSPVVRDCVFEENTVLAESGVTKTGLGSAIACTGDSSVTIEDCRFFENSATGTPVEQTGQGGAISLYDSASATIDDCTFMGNTVLSGGVARTGNGGAISNTGGSVVVTSCGFRDNAANRIGSDGGSGGAVASRAFTASIVNCEFVNNLADHVGGAVLGNTADNHLTITRCTFVGNRAPWEGGAVWHAYGKLSVHSCIFAGNACDHAGAALFSIWPHLDHNAELVNSLFVGNCSLDGAAIGNISAPNREIEIRNCGVFANTGDRGGVSNFKIIYNSRMSITNSVLWGNQPVQLSNAPGCFLTVSYSCIEDGWPGRGNMADLPLLVGGPTGSWTASAVYNAQTGETTFYDDSAPWESDTLLDGKFLNPDVAQCLQSLIVRNDATSVTVLGDFATLGAVAATYQVSDFHPAFGSSIIDVGTNAAVTTQTDLDGKLRIVDGDEDGVAIVEMGAYEFPGCASSAACPDADVNCDHVVNGLDVAEISSSANFG